MNIPNSPLNDTKVPAGTQANAQARPAWVPEKFWDDENGEVRLEALARSYQALENRLGSGEGSNPVFQTPDVPDHPGAYDIMIDDDLLDIDDEVNKRLHENGFSQSQAQLVYDLASERMTPMVAQISAQYENAREEDLLHEHFGGQERFAAIRPQLRAWGEANLDKTVFENLVASSAGVIAMFEMMKNREPNLMRAADKTSGNSEQDLKRMMKDPRYWKERDPSYVSRVRQGFAALYPEA
ncbi:MAG: hypothetical protein JKY27_13645 [Magnetovibrio sp.]|nr:hypothetical protein [Magnetovibrio sp.]